MNINRLIAFVIDFTIASAVFKTLNSIVNLEFLINEIDVLGVNLKLSFSLLLLIVLIYFVMFDIINKGKTVGKIIMKLTIQGQSREEVQSKSLVYRSLYKTLGLLILPISFILYIFKNQFIFQDRFSNLKVVNKTEA